MTGVSELDSPGPPDVVADTDAAFAEYAIVIIANPERAVLTDRELLGDVGRQLVQTDVVDGSLQLSIAALQGVLVDSAMLLISAPESGIGVSGEHKLQAVVPQFLETQLIGMDNHTFGYRGNASELRVSNAFHFNYTETAGPIGLQLGQGSQAWIITQGWYINASFLGRFENSCPLLHLHLSGVNGKSDLFHFAPHLR
jgi:hypothetical protein